MSSYLITGCSRGLGLELVSQILARPGVNLVFATARNAPSPALQTLIDTSAGRLIYIPMDPTNLASTQDGSKLVEKHLDGAGLDVLINNIGHMPYSPNGIATMDDLSSTFEVNVVSAHNVTSVLLPFLEAGKRKTVLNLSTTLGSLAMAPRFNVFPVPAYKVAKAALNMLTVQYALEYAEKGFIFMSASPGWVKTDLGGQTADLRVDESASALLSILDNAGKDSNGKFFNVLVKGWENATGLNQYAGGNPPW